MSLSKIRASVNRQQKMAAAATERNVLQESMVQSARNVTTPNVITQDANKVCATTSDQSAFIVALIY